MKNVFQKGHIKNNDINVTLKWMTHVTLVRKVTAHPDKWNKLTDDEEKQWEEIRANVFQVCEKLENFSIT